MTRVGALAAALAVASIATFAQHVQAEDIPTTDPTVVTGGPIGVLVMGGGPDDGSTGVEEPAPPTVDDSPPPSNDPPPSGDTASGDTASEPVAAVPGASAPRPPRRLDALVGNPAAGTSPKAASALPTHRGEGLSLEDIFLNNRPTSASPGAALSHSSRSAIALPSSSLPSMLITTLFVMLGALLATSRYYGSSFLAWPLGTAMPRRNAPRGWRVVATTPPPMPGGTIASVSDLERPVLAVKSPATSSR